MADKIVLLDAGLIKQIGTPDEVYDRPANKYVADFIGSPAMNFLEGRVEALEGRPVFRAEHVDIALPSDLRIDPGHRAVCGVRPNDVVLAEAGSIHGELILAEKTGADVQLHVRVQDHDFVAVAPRHVTVSPGQAVTFEVDPGKVHLFDAETEERLN